jgi:hypothetical protein
MNNFIVMPIDITNHHLYLSPLQYVYADFIYHRCISMASMMTNEG